MTKNASMKESRVKAWWGKATPGAKGVALSAAAVVDASLKIPRSVIPKPWDDLSVALRVALVNVPAKVYESPSPITAHFSFCSNGKVTCKELTAGPEAFGGAIHSAVCELLRSGIVMFDVTVGPQLPLLE
jgi:hypothetical protein